MSDTEYAATARHLAARLTSLTVLDHEGRPSWTGDDIDPTQPPSTDPPRLTHGPLDDGLLTGRAGIAVALAGCADLPGGDVSWAELAHRTLQTILAERSAGPGPAPGSLGWQSGDLGIARAASLVGGLLQDGSLVRAGQDLAVGAVRALRRSPSLCPPYPDLLDGEAGHLLAVLTADLPTTAESVRHEVATALVGRIEGRVRHEAQGASWLMAGYAPGVVGLAHGGSGIALALSAAAAAGIGVADALVADALRWEESHYVSEDGGWPDLRVPEPVPGLAWCHGAPGVGMSAALRSTWSEDPGAMITFTRASRAAAGHRPRGSAFDGTLCHGLTGVVELHLAGAEAWPEAAAEHLRAARVVARNLTRAGQDGRPLWTCGVVGGRTPNVLTGLAGVAITLLRCHDPSILPTVAVAGPRAQ